MAQSPNRYHWLVIAGLWLWLWSSSPAFSEQLIIDSAGQFDFARTCLDRGEYERAVGEFERFIHFFPGDPLVSTARRLIGICYLKDRRFDRARETFLEIISAEPGTYEAGRALLLTGETYYQQGISTEADYYLKQVIENPPGPDLKDMALYRLGWTMMQAGRWREASKTFGKVGPDSTFFESARRLSEQSLKGEELPEKNPVYAGTLAALIPGLGHAYVSRYRDAALAFVLNGVFIWATVESFHQDHEVLGGMLMVLEAGWYTGNIYSAVNCAHKYNRKRQDDFRDSLEDQFGLHLFIADKGCGGLVLRFQF